MTSRRILTASLLTIGTLATAAPAFGQTRGYEGFRSDAARSLRSRPKADEAKVVRAAQRDEGYHFASRVDSLEWARYKTVAEKSNGFRVIVSLQDRHVWVISDEDTLLSAPVAVAKGTTLTGGGQQWKFDTPRGVRHVRSKDADPIWNPPDWLYYETAKENGLKVASIPSSGSIKASDGRRITVQNNRVGVIDEDGFSEFPTKLHIIVGETLYIPPLGTDNRRVAGTLGKYKLDTGDGYMLHGTPDQNSIGLAATHGCVRLRDEDIEWLYDNVLVGTRVYIY
jgi:hypothetical protein